jgi:hypothetical protein
METSELNLVAWWGAVIAYIALVWNVFSHFSHAPRIKVKIKDNVTYTDARIISVTKTEHGESNELAAYKHVDISNIGKLPTTLIKVEATHAITSGAGRMSYGVPAIKFHEGKVLPLLLALGELCSFRIDNEHVLQLAQRGAPEVHIELSHLDQPVVKNLGHLT